VVAAATHRETSFTHIANSHAGNPPRGNSRGAYTSLPTTEPSRPSPPLPSSSSNASRSRWVSSSLASSRSDLVVSESKSTEPLLPAASPTAALTAAALDLEGIPPPPRPYSGPAPPPLPPPPPHPYSDRMTLPLNAGQLRGLHLHHPQPPSSYANIGMQGRGGVGGGSEGSPHQQSAATAAGSVLANQPRDVMIHAGKKNFSTSEISV
jgi:hypothetical protein